MKTPQEGDLRIWWIPQVPGTPFHVSITNLDEAVLLVTTLADYDLFQYENRIKGDYCNTGGMEEYHDGEWLEWHHPSTDQNIDEIMWECRG